MADNTRLSVGTGGDLIRTEDIGGQYKIAVSKIYLGTTGVDDGPVTQTRPLPVSIQGSAAVSGAVTAIPSTGVLMHGTTTLEPKYASISVNTNGANTLVPSVVGKSIRVLQYLLVAGGTVALAFRSGASVLLSGSMPLGGNGGVGVSVSPFGHFQTQSGEALNLVLSADVQVSGHLTYVEV